MSSGGDSGRSLLTYTSETHAADNGYPGRSFRGGSEHAHAGYAQGLELATILEFEQPTVVGPFMIYGQPELSTNAVSQYDAHGHFCLWSNQTSEFEGQVMLSPTSKEVLLL